MRRLRLPPRLAVFVGILAAAIALEGWAPAPAWAPPPPRPRRRLLPRRVVPRVVPIPAPKPAPAVTYRLKNLLDRPLVINLPEERVLRLPALGSVAIAEADLSAPGVQAHIDRGHVAVVAVKP